MCISDRVDRGRGFTLPELLLLIIVLSIALVGILLVINLVVSRSADPLIRKQAMAVAESMLEEVLLQPYTQQGAVPSPKDQTTRSTFNDITDYDTFATSGIYTIDGTAIAGLSGYSVRVDVAAAALGSVASTDSRRITVTVTGPSFSHVLEGYKLNIPTP